MDPVVHASRWRRIRRSAAWIAGSVVVLPVAVVALVLLALTVRPIRDFAVERGVKYANGSLDGYSIAIKSIDRVDPWGLNARGIQLFDDKHRELVNVPWAMVRLAPFSLLHKVLTLTQVEIDGARVRLYPADPNEPPKPEEPDSGPSTFVVRAKHARIRGAEAELELADQKLHVSIGTLSLGGVYGPKPAIALQEANVRVTQDDAVLVRLHTTEGAWSAERGGRVGVVAQLADAPLTLHADLPALDDMEPWPIKTLELDLSNVDRRTLKLFGVPDGAGLHTAVSLTLTAKVIGKKLSAKLKLFTGRHSVASLGATADDDTYELSVAVPATQLAAIATLLPNLKVQGNLLAHATHGADRMPKKVDLRWQNIAVDDGAFPNGSLRAELPLPIVRLLSVTLAGLENQFTLQGEYDLKRSRGKGAVQFRELRLDSIPLFVKQGLSGLLDGGLKADVEEQTLSADGKLTMRDFKHPTVQLAALDLALSVTGTLRAPLGNFTLSLDRLSAGDVKLDKLSANGLATPRILSAKVTAIGPDTNMRAELGGQRGEDGSLRVQGIGRGVVRKRELRFDLRELHYRDKALNVEELSLFTGKQSIVLKGSLDAQDRLAATLKLTQLNLADWASLANAAGLEGMVSGTAKVSGSLSLPRVDSTLNLTQVRYKSELPIDGTIGLQGDLATRKAALTLGLYSSDELGARIEATVAIPKRPAALSEALLAAHVHTKASLFLPVRQVSALAGDQLAGLEGMLDAKLTADGTLEAPTLALELNARLKLPEQAGDPVEALNLSANLDHDQAKVSLWAHDEEGTLVSVDGSLAWPGGNPRAALRRPTAFRESKFELAAELSPRRLDTMRGVFAYFSKLYTVSLPLSAGGKIMIQGDKGRLGGTAQLQATIYGDKLDGRCRLGTTSALQADLKLKEDRVDVKLGAKTDGGGSLSGSLSSVLSLNALTGEAPVFGPAKLTLEGDNIAIYKLPGLCNLASGNASFKATAEGLGKLKPSLDLTATIKSLSAPHTESMNVDLQTRVHESDADLTASFKSKTRQVGTLRAHVPLSYAKGSPTPSIAPDAQVQGRVQFDKLRLANVLSFTESFGRINGDASADISVRGKLNDPSPEGYLEFSDVNLSIAELAQPFHGVNGRVEIKGRSVKLKKLTAQDRGGKLSVQGFANLNQDLSGDGGLYLEATRFPLRQQGTIVGELTMRARVDAKVGTDLKAEAQLKILDGRIWLTGERGKSVQNLDAHPDIRFADEKTASDTEAEQTIEGHPGLVLGLFTIKTQNDLWLEHEDFSLQVGVDLKLTQDQAGPKLLGQATLERGELKLLGKSFKLKNGAIRFTGDMPPDPELDIKAIFTPPAGQNLIVQVTGRGSAPIVEFSGAASTAGEAVAVLTGKSGANQSKSSADTDATSQMAGLASNMTAGLLVMSARRRFGDWVPMISINTGASGEPAGASAGFDASKLIPPWAKGFARSAYVEGMIGQQTAGQSGGSVGLGVKLEVALPRDFVTDLGYGPGSSWSTDLAWAP